jgi:hypothetical protein
VDAPCPFTVSVASPAVAESAAVNETTCCPPALTLNGDAGEVVTPDGSPLNATATDPVNPPVPVTATVVVTPAVPRPTVTVEGATEIEKSGVGGGDGGDGLLPPPFPPQAVKSNKNASKALRMGPPILSATATGSWAADWPSGAMRRSGEVRTQKARHVAGTERDSSRQAFYSQLRRANVLVITGACDKNNLKGLIQSLA